MMVSEDFPIVTEMDALDVDAGIRTKKLVRKMKSDFFSQKKMVTVRLEEKDLNSLLVILSRGIHGIRGRSNISSVGMLTALSIYVPRNPFGKYINLRISISPSTQGINIDSVTMGGMELPGKLGLKLLSWFLNYSVGGDFGSRLLNSIQSVDLKEQMLVLRYRPMQSARSDWKRFKSNFKGVRDHLFTIGDRDSIRHYYNVLCQKARQLGPGRHSLSVYLRTLFASAARRSINSSAVNENRSAMLAMAILLGSERFQIVIGNVISQKQRDASCIRMVRNVVLKNRRDLRLHFVYSAAIKLLSDQDVSNTVGELKEMMDLGKKNSGFSFIDLAADFAGIRFATVSVQNELSAVKLQKTLQRKPGEATFFPDISGLYEGFSESEFRKYYTKIDSIPYKSVVKDIKSRISRLELYRDIH
jgi:hypothetical protein